MTLTPQPESNVPTMTTTRHHPSPLLFVSSTAAQIATYLRAVGPGVEIVIASDVPSPWCYTLELMPPPAVEPSGAKIAPRLVLVEIAAYAPADEHGHVRPDLRCDDYVLGHHVSSHWGFRSDDGSQRNRAETVAAPTLTEAIDMALAILRGAAKDAEHLASARAMAIAAEEARYAAALAH